MASISFNLLINYATLLSSSHQFNKKAVVTRQSALLNSSTWYLAAEEGSRFTIIAVLHIYLKITEMIAVVLTMVATSTKSYSCTIMLLLLL